MSKISRKQEIRDESYMKKTFHLSQWINPWALFGSLEDGWQFARDHNVTSVAKF